MIINVLPGIRKSHNIPGVLGLYVKLPDSLFAINLTPGVFKKLKESCDNEIAEFDRHLVFFSTNPMNLGALEPFSKFIESSPYYKMTYSAPESLCGWFHALIRETDYNSDQLKSLSFNPFSTNTTSTIQFSSRYVINYIPSLEGFADYIIRIKFGSPNVCLNFCEIRDITAPFPAELAGSDILVCNLSRFPNITKNDSDYCAINSRLKIILRDHNIKSALLPSPNGIHQLLPSTKPDYENVVEDDTYSIKLKQAEVTVTHDKRFANYKRSIFPVLIEDEKHRENIMLGLDLGAALHLRLKQEDQFDFSSILLAGCSFHHVFALTDVMDQLKAKKVNLFCGKYMASAITHFKSLFFKTFSREVKNNLKINAGDQGKTIRHLINDAFEIILIPYPGNPDSYIIRITDTATSEVLLFTDAILNKTFFEKNLQGVTTLVFALSRSNKSELETYQTDFAALQEKLTIKKVIILYPGGTIISDSDIQL